MAVPSFLSGRPILRNLLGVRGKRRNVVERKKVTGRFLGSGRELTAATTEMPLRGTRAGPARPTYCTVARSAAATALPLVRKALVNRSGTGAIRRSVDSFSNKLIWMTILWQLLSDALQDGDFFLEHDKNF